MAPSHAVGKSQAGQDPSSSLPTSTTFLRSCQLPVQFQDPHSSNPVIFHPLRGMGHHYKQEVPTDHTFLVPTQQACRMARLEVETEGPSPDTEDEYCWLEGHLMEGSHL